MYVCPKCNSSVDQPKRRWWSGWRYCPNGHVLYVRGLGPSLERSFWKSFLRALARGIIVFSLIVLTLAAAPEYQARTGAPGTGFVVAIFYLFVGLSLLRKGALVGGTGRAGPKTGYSCEGQSLRFSCRRYLPTWHRDSATVCEVRFPGKPTLKPLRQEMRVLRTVWLEMSRPERAALRVSRDIKRDNRRIGEG